MRGRRTLGTPLRTLACAGLVGVHLAGCGALLGVDHDWDLAAGADGGVASTGDATGSFVFDGDDTNADAPTTSVEDSASGDALTDDAGCGVGDLGCSDAQPQICAAGGVWHNVGAACSGSSPACLAGACVACTPNSLGCSGQQPQTCNATGTWQNADAAACSNQACVSGACTGTCTPGASVCYYNYVLLCTATGTWGVTGVQC